jgi:hypothetical protein
MKLEGAEVKLSQTANKVRLKWEKNDEKRNQLPKTPMQRLPLPLQDW